GLYLWHWPVNLAIVSGPLGVNLTRLVATFALATASFYLIERPIRRGRAWLVRPSPRWAATAVLLLAAVTGTAVWATRTLAPAVGLPPEIAGCPSDGDAPCLRHQGPEGAPVVALVGDSIARSLDPTFMTLASEHGWTYVLAATNGCRL